MYLKEVPGKRNCDFWFGTLLTRFFVEGEWELRLSGLERARIKGANGLTKNAATAAIEDERLKVALVLYSFYTGVDHTEGPIPRRFEFGEPHIKDVEDTPDARKFRYEHLRHLIKVMECDPLLPYADFLKHPVFWPVMRLASFELRIRSFLSSARTWAPEYTKYMVEGRSYVFEGKWTARIPKNLIGLLLKPTGGAFVSDKTFLAVAMVRRNRGKIHRDEGEGPYINTIIGTLPIETNSDKISPQQTFFHIPFTKKLHRDWFLSHEEFVLYANQRNMNTTNF